MTRKHFVALAANLSDALDKATTPEKKAGVVMAIKAVTATCAGFNPQFDSNRFEAACGLGG